MSPSKSRYALTPSEPTTRQRVCVWLRIRYTCHMPPHAISIALLCIAVTMSASACSSKKSAALNPFVAQDVSHLAPATLTPTTKYSGDVRTARVRVYAGHEYRAQVQRWQDQFNELVDQINQLLIPEFGVRLDVVDVQPWTRQSTNSDLAGTLEELVDRDSGADVEWVIGLVSALSSATPNMHALGKARVLGRHIVLRGHSDLELRKALGKNGDENLFRLRKQHKQTAVFLHEIAHTLGAIHAVSTEKSLGSLLMNAAYRRTMKQFSPHNRDNMTRVLDARLRRRGKPSLRAEAVALRDHLRDHEGWPGWHAEERQQLQTWLESAIASAPADEPEDTPESKRDPSTVPKEARLNFGVVQKLASQGKLEAALHELKGLMTAYPANAAFRLFACQLWLQREGPKQNAIDSCMRVGELDPRTPRGELALTGAYLKAGALTPAHQVLNTLAARVPDMGDQQESTWNAILAIYQGLRAVTWAEHTVANVPPSIDTKSVRAWAIATRRRYGLPPNGAPHRITPEREGEYVSAVRQVLDATYAKDYKKARKLAQKGLRLFRNGPGFLGALCDLEYRARRFAAARTRCAKSLRLYAEASWPRYLMGILELRQKRNRTGIKHLNKAIDMDPDLKQAYHAVYKAYARIKDREGMNRTRETYFKRFGVALPTR